MKEVFFTDKSRVKASFERAAHSYDGAAVLQQEVAQRMEQRLDYIKIEPQVILDAGSGTGRGAEALRRRYPHARVIELDLAESMLRVSRGKQAQSAGWVDRLLRRAQPWQVCARSGTPAAGGWQCRHDLVQPGNSMGEYSRSAIRRVSPRAQAAGHGDVFHAGAGYPAGT
jgi:SAM-dependent methyltransferase